MTRKQFTVCAVVMTLGVLVGAVVGMPQSLPDATEHKSVWRTLDTLHKAASEADGETYFNLFAPDAVFIGTDATERWTLDEFKAFAEPRFDAVGGWTYTLKPGTRKIRIEGDIAWFDELMQNEKYGTCRGSGVLRKVESEWKLEQYVLSLTVPNDVALAVVELIRDADPQQ